MESLVQVALFDDKALAEAYGEQFVGQKDVMDVEIKQMGVDSLAGMHRELKALPFNPKLPEQSKSSANDNGTRKTA